MISCSSALLRYLLPQLKHRFYGTTTYDGEGKTTMQILNNEENLGLMINGFSQVGFRLNNDFTILGPIVIFPRTVLSWQVTNIEDINENSLAIFPIIEPKIDLLIIGVGDPLQDNSFQKRLLPFIRKHKFNVEVLATEYACSTFNFLNSENRFVAGALIPPTQILSSDDDVLQNKIRYQNLYETE